MFTGLIRDIGKITALAGDASGVRLTIAPQQLAAAELALGASIACNGICLTATERTADGFTVYASAETLARTTVRHWQEGMHLNLEPSLRLGDELGGHLVFGHVDGEGACTDIVQEGASWNVSFTLPETLAPLVAVKGSVAVDGVSLTVNRVSQHGFGVTLIPHTWQHTTLRTLQPKQPVNLEADMLARYVARQRDFAQREAA